MTIASSTSPFHAGELDVQRRAGESERAVRTGAVIGDRIPERALAFVAAQTLAVIGSRDAQGDPWVSLLVGAPGFAHAPNNRSLVVNTPPPLRDPDDPLWTNLERDPAIGLLFIETATRRRLRVNGNAVIAPDDAIHIDVEQAYPNCPKYIERRTLVPNEAAPTDEQRGTELRSEHLDRLRRADTLFVASAHPERGVDASHRGGSPGFIAMPDANTLRIPDYAGNSMFNTLGNLAVRPRAAIVVPDLVNGRQLQITGDVTLRFDLEDGDTGRAWDLVVTSWRASHLPLSAIA